ncbi:MAG TPA: PilZ domain-containing protein [Polyangia bacterium]|nr:PilZ domain-containing protein [Polyangia bacterium]
MSAAVIVVASIVVVGVVMWRATASASPDGRPRTLSMIQRERRRQSRIVPPSDRPAELQIMGRDFLEIPEVRDISENGLAISVPHKFNGHKPTQEVDLLLTLHGQGTVRARGAIRHVSYTRSDTATFGVELVAIEDEDRDKIRRYVEKVQEGVPEPVADDAPADAGPRPARRTR